ncbi:MAG: hydroxymethylglutaryl-CoA lyase [Acidobacteriaceae bacterium]
MAASVKLIECPRDAWQGLETQIPTEIKADYLKALVSTGFRHIDAVSFVSPKAVPQMADSEKVLELLDPPDDVEIIGIVVNEKGAERAIATDAVRTLGFPYSVSETFLKRNQNQTAEENYDALEAIYKKADEAGLDMVVYISMAFGNPYGDPWSIDEVIQAMENISDLGVLSISLADTVGIATAEQIAALSQETVERFEGFDTGVHLHARREDALGKILAAYDAGIRRFDSAIGGLGGCPFAGDKLVGNIPTEIVIEALESRGVGLTIRKPLDKLIAASEEIGKQY